MTRTRRPSRLSLLFALCAALSVALGGMPRAQAAGDMIRTEMLLAPLLALGGSVADLCAAGDGDGTAGHHADCVATCQTATAAVTPGPWLPVPVWTTLRPAALPRSTVLPVATRTPPGPPVRAPPARA